MDEDIDKYHTVLLRALRQHRRKFSLDLIQYAANEKPQGIRHQGKFRENPLLKNYREFFEAGLLRILSREDLDDADIQLLPFASLQELLFKFHEFFGLLDEIASDNPELSVDESRSCQGFFQPSGSYPRLERLLSFMDLSEGPFTLTAGSGPSIFVINTLVNGKAARSVVQELNQILDAIQLKSQKRHVAAPKITASDTTAVDNWIQSFDREYRLSVGKILETIGAEFAKCEGNAPREYHDPHQVIIQLPNVALSELPRSEIHLDSSIYCPGPRRWQNTRCKLIK